MLTVARVVTASIVAGLCVLLHLEGDEDVLLSSAEVALSSARPKVFQYLADMNNYAKWFPGIIRFEADDTLQMGVGKHFLEAVEVPFIGEVLYDNVIVGYESPRYISFMTDNWMKYRIEMRVERRESTLAPTAFKWTLYSRRRDYLTKYLVKPVVQLLYMQKGRQAMFNIRDVFYKI